MMRTTQIFFLLSVLLPLCTVVTSNAIKHHENAFQKPGECPPERNYKRDTINTIKNHKFCQNDINCENYLKCCRDNDAKICKPPAQDKPGQCPTYDTSLMSATTCGDNCTSDSECPGSTKCCPKLCGKTCVDLGKPSTEIAPRQGFCKQEALYKCAIKERTYCDENSCINGYKCCPKVCTILCLPPISERNGVCPANADCPSPDANKSCSSDYDCSAFYKCCPTSCGQRCLRATNVTLSIHG